MRRTSRVLLVAVFVLGLVAAGCGDDDDSAATTTSTSEPSGSTTTERPEDFEVFLLPAEMGEDCSEVIGVPRSATVEGDVGDALAQLLAGPAADEEAQGLSSWFSSETEGMLGGVVVENGVAEVDFEDFSGIIPNASSSCGSASLLAQLDSTVLQFDGIDQAIYSFNGDRDAFYEWLQLDAPAVGGVTD